MSLNNTQLPKVIFNWDSKCRGNTWSLNIQSIFNEIDQQNVVANNLQVSINNCWALFHEIQCNQWSVQENLNYVYMSLLKIPMKSILMLCHS